MQKLKSRGAILGLLTLVYMFNFIDRQIVGVLAPFIKADLGLSGTQIGLLTGVVFALFYTIIGIPIASMVDNTKTFALGGFRLRFDRVTIIALSLAAWSFFTMLTGFAGGFVALALLRIGVAIGEAGCSPPSHSLISDLYAPNERARALGTYALGIPFGIMLAYFASAFFAGGGTVDWRLAFVVIGLVGVPVAVLTKLLVPEPERGRLDGGRVEPMPFRQALSELGKIPSYWTMALGIAFASFGSYAVNAFLTLYIYGEPGQWAGAFATIPIQPLLIGLGLGNAVFYASGTYLGGVVADHFGKKHVAAYALVPAVTVGIAAVAVAIAWLAASPVVFFVGLSIYIFFLGFYLGPSFSVAQNLAKISVRATSTAVFFFVLNLIALGGGPSVTGFLYDHFAVSMDGQLVGLRWALIALSVAYALSVIMFLVTARLLPRDWARAQAHNAPSYKPPLAPVDARA